MKTWEVVVSGESREKTTGFVGLGMMGGAMAANILKAGHPLVVYDVDHQKNESFGALGAQIASGPADVARRAQIVISMVDTTAQAEEVIVGPKGFIEGATTGDVVMSMSTIDPMALQRMHQTLAAKGIDLIDAPVAGYDEGARRGTLKAYVGGKESALEKCRPVLKSMTSEIRHLGSIGQGTMMKLVNNMLAQAGRILVVEALVLGAKAGLDPQMMFEVISKSSGNSDVFQYTAPKVISRKFEGPRMDITYKDLELETQVAKALQVPMFMANVAQQVYQMGRAAGLGGEETSAIVKVYEQLTGVSLARK
jgi:3-hydroxyisobutyrate dehydrogenase-like beta-hydroxyacid dehydrogenase